MAGANATVSSNNHQVTIGTSTGSFVQKVARNNQTITETTNDADQKLHKYSSTSGTGTYQSWSQYLETSGAGNHVAPVGNTGDNFKIIVPAGFEAIPEPGPAVLLLRRKRR